MFLAPDRRLARLALIGTLVAALGLAACGRKGPLELPPAAVNEAPVVANQPTAPGRLPSGEPVPASRAAPKKHFFLDFLL